MEFTPHPGENVVEFRDIPLPSEPDWLEYLERYPDVKNYLITRKLPLEQGAHDHFESNGRAEGRSIHLRAVPGPDEGYYFMFRNIRLEGFRTP